MILHILITSILLQIIVSSYPAPQYYTQQQPIDLGLSAQPYLLKFSPDLMSFAYMEDLYCKYIRFRTSIWNHTQTLLDGSRIVTFGFDSRGQRLYLVMMNSTKNYELRYFEIKNQNVNQTSRTLYYFNIQESFFNNSVISISEDKIVMSINYKMCILFLSQNKTAVVRNDYLSRQSTVSDLQWHHLEPQTLFFCTYSTQIMGEAQMYNSTSRVGRGFEAKGLKGLGVMLDGSVYLVSNQTGIGVYSYGRRNAQLMFFIQGFQMNSASVSSDKTMFVAWSKNQGVRVYKMSFTSNNAVDISHLKQQKQKLLQSQQSSQKMLNINFDIWFSKSSFDKLSFASISNDMREIYFYKGNNTNINRWSRCEDNSYYENQQCVNCSPKCRTCSVSAFQCTSCGDQQFLTQDGKCSKCEDSIDFCVRCSFSTQLQTLICNKCHQGFVYKNDTKNCGCPEGYEMGTTISCTKISPSVPNNNELQLWVIFVVFEIVLLFNMGICYGIYWLVRRRQLKYQRVGNKDDKGEEGPKDEDIVKNRRINIQSILSDRDQIRQRLVHQGR